MIYCWIALDTRQPTTAAMDKATEWAQTFSCGSGWYIYILYICIYTCHQYQPVVTQDSVTEDVPTCRCDPFRWFSHLLLMEFVSPASFGDSLMAFEQSWKVEVQWLRQSGVFPKRDLNDLIRCHELFFEDSEVLRIQCCFQFEGICMHL